MQKCVARRLRVSTNPDSVRLSTATAADSVAPWHAIMHRGTRAKGPLTAMSKHLERDLDNLQKNVLLLAGAVEEVIYKAIRALQDRRVDVAQEVIAGDEEIDQQENHVEEECLKILALHQP